MPGKLTRAYARCLFMAGLSGVVLLTAASLFAQQPGGNKVIASDVTPEMRRQANEHYQRHDWAGAAETYAVITNREPQNGNAWYRLAKAQDALGQLATARTAYERAVATQPNPYYLYDLACAYARLDEKDQALAVLERAVQSGYRRVEEISTDEALANIRADARFTEIVRKAMPCATQPEAAQFDFWLGEWNVTNAQGQPVGTNRITRILGQCVVFEEFSEFLGGGGRSFNLYHAPKKRWEQTWVDDRGGVLHFTGAFTDGAMRLTGMSNNAEGKPVQHRMSYTPQADGRVRQLWESSTDEGKTWTVTFDGLYVRRK